MQKSELDYLYLEKKKEGKDSDEANYEIDFLVGSQVEFKKVKKELNRLHKIIDKKDKLIAELKQQLSKIKEHNFKLKFNKDSEPKIKREDSRNNLSGYINRILNHLESEKEYTKTDISKELLIPRVRMNECLELLKRMKKIDFRINEGVVRYRLVNGN